MKVSVVIPVYNVERYLERCVQSVQRQTYQNIEIILIDDGSPDGSGLLCDQLAEKDQRIRVIHQENQGLSGARNTGIHNATGEYIIFMDSDDEWLLDDGLEALLNNGKGNDLIVFKNADIWKNGHITQLRDYDVENIAKLPDAHAVFYHLVITGQFRMSACFLLIRRELLVNHEIYFPIGYISEDVFWSLHLWQHAKTVTIQNLVFYGYCHHDNSISTSPYIRAYQSYDKIFNYWKEQCDNGCNNAQAIRIYLANMWVNRGYTYYQLDAANKPEALNILHRHKDLLQHAATPKSKRIDKLVKFIGVRNTAVVLGYYWQLRTKIKQNAV